ncbi:MAG: hypothetical protein EPO09_21820 [Aquabacterium sp.]|uniref:hypothetical protein n=1 Tax=Aquabacterium sp. TaxID=1872578 RepID=UPI00122B240F|nr:hypothetical protein [Aquabacterium sp.]TAK81828.1 MAG: hypothetical protein EPO09_21820 [Aquabacterium sp.]
MAATGFLNPHQQFFDDDGDPLAGGFIYTYTAGTSTPVATYFASDLLPGSENTNPIELDSAGRCIIYPPTPAGLKIIVKDANLLTVYTQDNASPAAVAS